MEKSTGLRKPLKLLIGIPCMDMVHTQFLKDLLGMLTYLSQQELPRNYQLVGYTVETVLTSILSHKRELVVQGALDTGATHILFLDSDQAFPPDLVHRLLRHGKKCVAANIATKTLPTMPTARKLNAKGTFSPVMPRGPEESRENPLEAVHMVGCGIMLLSMAAIKALPDSKGLFPVSWNKEISGYTGEDWNFVESLKRAGVQIWIDHDLSWDVGHMGQYRYDYPAIWQQSQHPEFQKRMREAEDAASSD